MTNGTAANTQRVGGDIVPFVTRIRGETSEPRHRNATFSAYSAFSALFPVWRSLGKSGQVLKALRAHKAHTSPRARERLGRDLRCANVDVVFERQTWSQRNKVLPLTCR
jgi:hypothetical protein